LRVTEITGTLSSTYPRVDVIYDGNATFVGSSAQLAYSMAKAVAYEYLFSSWFFLVNSFADLLNSKYLFAIGSEIHNRTALCSTEKILHTFYFP
jgi:hypothetical protein